MSGAPGIVLTSTPGVAEGFGAVADAFQATVADDGRSGAALSIWRGGEPIVDLWAGVADASRSLSFTADTLTVIFSCTKGLASVLVAMLIEDGSLPSYETPIGEVWPEFAQHGKGGATIGDVLAHRGGVSAPRRALTREEALDPLRMADALAGQEPLWLPGSSHQYHPVTHGALTAKLVTVATGQSIGAVLRSRIADPLKADVWIGLPVEEEERVATLIPGLEIGVSGPEVPAEDAYWLQRSTDLGGAFDAVDIPGRPEMWNDPEVHRAEIPGAGGIASARALAKVWSSTVVSTEGVRLLGADAVDRLRRVRSQGPAYFAGEPPYQAFGAGVMTSSPWDPYLSADSFGHDGAGGHVAFADPKAEVGFAYITNQMGDWERGMSVTDALRQILG